MGLKLIIERGGKTLLEFPLFPDDWQEKDLKREVEQLSREAESQVKFYEIFTNENRIKMLKSLFEGEEYTLKFKEFREDLKLNPKIIRENALKLQDVGFIDSPRRGEYRLLKRGQICFLTTVIVMRHVLRTVMEECQE